MEDKLSALSRYTVIVADTGDIAQIKASGAQDCTTNPQVLILKAASKPDYAALMDDAVAYAMAHEMSDEGRVEFGAGQAGGQSWLGVGQDCPRLRLDGSGCAPVL